MGLMGSQAEITCECNEVDFHSHLLHPHSLPYLQAWGMSELFTVSKSYMNPLVSVTQRFQVEMGTFLVTGFHRECLLSEKDEDERAQDPTYSIFCQYERHVLGFFLLFFS